MQVVNYTPEWKDAWNKCISESKNGTFLQMRDYMDYHGSRFADCSLIFAEGDNILGVLPANWVEEEQTVYSHQGLTYGGVVLNLKSTSAQVMQIFDEALAYYKETLGAKHIIYKPTPNIYHKYPSQEDLYAVWQKGGILKQRLLSSAIYLNHPLPFHHSRTANINRAIKNELYVEKNTIPNDFWLVLEEVLMKYHEVHPVHSLAEISLLMERFPKEIQLFTVKKEGKVIAGCLLYVTPIVVHTQYIASNEIGRKEGALDLLFKYLIHEKFKSATFFDFGTSNKNEGHTLCSGLIAQKEFFGGRGITYDTYEINMP